MKKTFLPTLAIIAVLATSSAFASTKTYQVTGPVLDLTAENITVQKGKDKWEIARGSAAVPADVKVGSKVTIQYTMTAATVTAKEEKPKKK